MILFTVNTNAQIIYTDITDGVPAGIDFNQDGTNEFTISNGASYIGDYIEYSGTNNIHAIGTIAGGADWDVPSCVELNFPIGESGNWAGAGDCAVNGWGSGGNPTITSNQDTYIACRISFGGTDLFYGWIRISVDASKTVTYKDYAYQSMPNTTIDAGDTGSTTGINDYGKNKSYAIYPNPAKNTINIDNKSKTSINEIRIIDFSGKEVKKVFISEMINIKKIDISELNTGMYFISLFYNGKKIGDKKLIVK